MRIVNAEAVGHFAVKPKVFVALPYVNVCDPEALLASFNSASAHKDRLICFPQNSPAGSHCENFNSLWCMALNSRERDGWTHFAMIHSDVIPEEGWLDKLLEIMERETVLADVLSVILPIKDNRGLTSTALMNRHTLHNSRFAMKGLTHLPSTFDANLAGGSAEHWDLLISSGLWIARFTEPWVEQVWFEMRDRIVRLPSGEFFAANFSEDWNFSIQCREQGCRVWATTEVSAKHTGRCDYDNQKPWGTWEKDEDASYGEWLKGMYGMSSLNEFPRYGAETGAPEGTTENLVT